jgi:hypothetical protein
LLGFDLLAAGETPQTERLMLGMILTGMLIGGAIALAVPAATIVGEYIRLAVLLIFVFAAGIGLWQVC